VIFKETKLALSVGAASALILRMLVEDFLPIYIDLGGINEDE
jgi:hypothetical protein